MTTPPLAPVLPIELRRAAWDRTWRRLLRPRAGRVEAERTAAGDTAAGAEDGKARPTTARPAR